MYSIGTAKRVKFVPKQRVDGFYANIYAATAGREGDEHARWSLAQCQTQDGAPGGRGSGSVSGGAQRFERAASAPAPSSSYSYLRGVGSGAGACVIEDTASMYCNKTTLHPDCDQSLCRIAVFSVKPTFLSDCTDAGSRAIRAGDV